VAAVAEDPALEKFKKALGIDETSVVLLFSTEGDTDPENYRRIVWDGKYPSVER
jgi:diaminopropionate ammonia-lyase